MDNAGKVVTSKRLKNDVDVIGHHAPGKNEVAHPCEMREGFC